MSLFKKKKESDFSGDDMDTQQQLKKILEQIGFLEKKIDSLIEGGGRGPARPFGGDRGGFNRNRGGAPGGGFRGNREGGHRSGSSFGNTRFAGDGPRRYNSDSNRGGFSGGRDGGPRREGGHRPPRRDNRPRPFSGNGENPGNHQQPAPSAAPEAQPE